MRRGSQQLQPRTVFYASRQAANAYGARSNEPDRSSEWSHDLFISEVYLRYRDCRGQEVANWYGESFLPKLGFVIKNMKDPDAFLLIGPRISRIIEIGGKYSVEHLEALHEHCAGGAFRRISEFAARNDAFPMLQLYNQEIIPYEIW